MNWNNHTISVNGEKNVTLPCPVRDRRDRKEQYNLHIEFTLVLNNHIFYFIGQVGVIDWVITLPNFNGGRFYTKKFSFANGRMLNSVSDPIQLPDNIRLADDKQSLIISNITHEFLGEYTCPLMMSRTLYRYTLTS